MPSLEVTPHINFINGSPCVGIQSLPGDRFRIELSSTDKNEIQSARNTGVVLNIQTEKKKGYKKVENIFFINHLILLFFFLVLITSCTLLMSRIADFEEKSVKCVDLNELHNLQDVSPLG